MATLAEQLGFQATDRVAIVHCDDIGMCHAANVGAFEALDHGPATTGSVMVPCPWFPEAAAMARERPEVDLGVHLTLNAEWPHYRWGPVAGASRVPTLVDAEGCLPRTGAEVLGKSDPGEVEVELRAQIDRALDAGIDVTHLDAHMGTALMPPLVHVYARLALDYRLPVFALRPNRELLAAFDDPDAADEIGRAVDAMEAGGVPILDAVDANSLHFDEGQGLAHNTARLDALPIGITYLICHPARDGEEIRAIAPEAHCRAFEHEFYGGDTGRRALEERGIRSVGMRALREWMRAA